MSNLELMRILAMFGIVAHHYVVLSGISHNFDFSNITPNMVFLQMWSLWGKTGINAFVLISGYFMCTRNLTVKRYAKVFLEVEFYNIITFLIFAIAGYDTVSIGNIAHLILWPIRSIGNSFTASFLAFYLFVPFYNIFIRSLNRKQHLTFLCMILFIYTIGSSIFVNYFIFSEPVWYAILYMVASYIRLYGNDSRKNWMNNQKLCLAVLVASVLLAYASVLVVDFVGTKYGFTDWTFMINDSHKLLAFLPGLFGFLFFRNLDIGYHPHINAIAATTFGILCIHTGSDGLESWLWGTVFKVSNMYDANTALLILHAVLVPLTVFAVCSILDRLRIRFIEKPVLRWCGRFPWWNKEF